MKNDKNRLNMILNELGKNPNSRISGADKEFEKNKCGPKRYS